LGWEFSDWRFVATASGAKVQLHQLNLGTNIASSSQALHDRASVTISQLMQHWFTSADAARRPWEVVFRQLLQQSEFLPSWTVSRSFAWLSLIMIPVVLLVHRFKVGGQPTAGH